MPIAKTARIHPTALLDPEVEVGEDVQIGPFVVIQGPVRIGAGCVIKPAAQLHGPLTLGEGNTIHGQAILGDIPQHLKFNGEQSHLEIGNNNIFRENVTIHRAMPGGVTRIGDRNFLMAGSHIGHDSTVGNACILANNALVAGHCLLEDGCLISGNSAIHQFVRIGRLALLSGVSASTKDVVPFMIYQRLNVVCGVNVVGMRRAGIPAASIEGVRKAYHILFLSRNVVSVSVMRLEAELSHIPEVAEIVTFIRNSKRGITLDTEREAA